MVRAANPAAAEPGSAVCMSGLGEIELIPMARADLVDPDGSAGALLPDHADLTTGALVAMTAAGVCGSDLDTLQNAAATGAVVGHELMGEVVWQGRAVIGDWVGATVTAGFNVACGACPACRGGHTFACTQVNPLQPGANGMGEGLGGWPGFQASFAFVPHADANLVAVAADADPLTAVLAEDVLPTALGAVSRAQIHAGASVWVVGGGPIGAATAFVAALLGARVVVSELRATARQRIEPAGVVVTASADPRESFGAAGAEHVIDCVGGPLGVGALTTLAAAIAPGGSLGLVGARVPTPATVASPSTSSSAAGDDLLASLWRRGLTLHAGITPARGYLDDALTIAREHAADLHALLGIRAFALHDVRAAYDHLRAGNGKPVLVPG